MASAVVAVDRTRHLLAAEDGLYLRRFADGRLTRFCPLEAEDGRTRSNDGRVHPSGALWISTMGREAEAGRGAIYHVAGTQVTRLYRGLTIPNAICFSPDGATGYFADTDRGILNRVPLDPRTGLPTGSPPPSTTIAAARAASMAPPSMPRGGSGAPAGERPRSTPTAPRARACAPSSYR